MSDTHQSGIKQGSSGLAIAGLVIAILAAITSFVPIVNNISFGMAILSLILAIAGMVSVARKKRSGKGIAIAGIVLSVVAIIVVLASQSMYSQVLDSATEGAQVVEKTEQSSDSGQEETAVDYSNLAVGESATLENGLVVSVDSIKTKVKSGDDKNLTKATVTYTNNSSEQVDFNPFDWKGEDSKGAQRDNTTFYGKNYEADPDELDYGELSAGGSVTGNIYFEGDITKLHYYSSALANNSAVAWKLD